MGEVMFGLSMIKKSYIVVSVRFWELFCISKILIGRMKVIIELSSMVKYVIFDL